MDGWNSLVTELFEANNTYETSSHQIDWNINEEPDLAFYHWGKDRSLFSASLFLNLNTRALLRLALVDIYYISEYVGFKSL